MAPLIHRILVAIDFSPESDAALAQALVLARQQSASITLAHVVPLPADLVEDSAYDPLFRVGSLAELTTEHRSGARDLLRQITERCRAEGVACDITLLDDAPSDGLARAAEDVGADLIAIGTHGRTGIKRVMLGSVAERTVRLAPCSTLVARGSIDPDHGFRRILVATDFSRHADAALDAALAIARPEAAIEVVHCWQQPLVPAGMPISSMRRDLEKNVAEAGARLLRERDAGRARFVGVEGYPAEGIRARAEDTGADLICLGSHGRRGVRRWLLGSIAETTVRHAPCSVLVVRLPGEQGEHG
ncbi:MAG TPA: universal stress protein [Kofleriaceae bacterium]|nr:universal stress protein [Kofleriaceae bacterium]